MFISKTVNVDTEVYKVNTIDNICEDNVQSSYHYCNDILKALQPIDPKPGCIISIPKDWKVSS